jgi:hypothetical protein
VRPPPRLDLDRGETAWAAHDERAALRTYRIATVLHAIGQHMPANWQDALTEFAELGLPEADKVCADLATFTCNCIPKTASTDATATNEQHDWHAIIKTAGRE